MPRGKAKNLVSLPARKGRAERTTAGMAATTQSSSIPENTSTRPKRTTTMTTKPPATKKHRTSTSGVRTGDSQEGSTANTNRQQAQRHRRVQASSAASGESQEGSSTLTTTDIPMIAAEVLRQTGVPDTQEIGDHEPVDHSNQSPFGTSSGATVNVQNLSRLSQRYYLSGLSPSTRKAYQVGFQAYKTFCTNTNRQKIPTLEATLLIFVTYLADQSCSSSTIKVYLAAIHNAHVAQGEHERFMEASTPRLQQVTKGIQRQQATVTRHRIRKPITICVMSHIQRILLRVL